MDFVVNGLFSSKCSFVGNPCDSLQLVSVSCFKLDIVKKNKYLPV